MATVKLPKKQQEILTLLNSSEDVLIEKGLEDLKAAGAETIIPDILEIFINASDEQLLAGLKDILVEIKSTKAVDHIFGIINTEKAKKHQAFLVSIIWQAGLDASGYLSDLVEIGINGDFMTCFECLTVIENFDSEFTEEEILKNMSILKDAIFKKDEKHELLHGMHEIIQNFIIG